MMPHIPRLLLLSLTTLILALPSPSPQLLLRPSDSPPPPQPQCFSTYPCATQCLASPNPSYCQQSINAVCASASNATTFNSAPYTWITYTTGLLSQPTLPSPNAPLSIIPATPSKENEGRDHCLAIAILSSNLVQALTWETCQAAFASISTCADETRPGYDRECIGGTINIDGCDSAGRAAEQKLIADERIPAYMLGSPVELGYASEVHPPDVRARRANLASVVSVEVGGRNGTVGPYAPV